MGNSPALAILGLVLRQAYGARLMVHILRLPGNVKEILDG
jgi:hypothetical protein